MNRHKLAILVIIAVAAFAWWFAERSMKRTPNAIPLIGVASELSTPTGPVAKDGVPAGGAYQGLSDPRWQWWNKMKALDRSFEWKIPIKFYGKVLDQDAQPVPQASIRYGWNAVDGSHQQFTKSGTDGRFAIEGIRGKILSVDAFKDGYHSSESDQHAFEYAAFFEADYHQPDPENPVTFRLVKKLVPEPLIVSHASVGGRYDRTYYFDLIRGKPTAGPVPDFGLKFLIERSETPQREPFDWKWKVEAVNGGLLETKDEVAQLAPEEGYVLAWELSGRATDRPFRSTELVRFYVRTGNNRFARVEIELSHPGLRSEGPGLIFDSFFNPSGSRNLEYDPRLQIRPGN